MFWSKDVSGLDMLDLQDDSVSTLIRSGLWTGTSLKQGQSSLGLTERLTAVRIIPLIAQRALTLLPSVLRQYSDEHLPFPLLQPILRLPLYSRSRRTRNDHTALATRSSRWEKCSCRHLVYQD